MSRSRYAEADRTVAEMVIRKIKAGEVPRPLTPAALLKETLSAFSEDLGLDQFPMHQHRRLASAVYAILVEAGIVRPTVKRRDMNAIRTRLREMADAMPPATVPQRDSTRPGFNPDEEGNDRA